MAERVLVAGCGYVGACAAAALVSRGCEVFGLRRQPRDLPGGVVPLAADLTDPASLKALPPGLDLVLYAASAGGGDEEAYRAAYVDGPRNLLDALARDGQAPRRVLFRGRSRARIRADADAGRPAGTRARACRQATFEAHRP